MGILDKVGEVVGAVAAVEALEKADPGAGLLAKGAAAVAGFEGAGALENLVEKKEGDADAAAAQGADDGSNAAGPQA